MLAIIRILGKHRMIADGCTGWNDEQRTVTVAAQVLTDWPKNFIELLKDLGEKLPANGHGGIAKQFRGIYRDLFKNRAIKPRSQADFFKAAFADFGMNHWGSGFVDHRLRKHSGKATPQRFLTQAGLAAQLGVAHSTAVRLVKDQKVNFSRVKCGGIERVLVDGSETVIPRTSPGEGLQPPRGREEHGVFCSGPDGPQKDRNLRS
jgi:hypothetical protein